MENEQAVKDTREEQRRERNRRARERRKDRDDAMRSLGLTKGKDSMGRTLWE